MVLAVLVCLSAVAPPAGAQDADSVLVGWKKSLIFDLTATQASYSDSWDGGEVGTFSWQTNLVGSAERQFAPKFNYLTNLKLSFGQTHSQQDNGDWLRPKKTTDLIDWENVGSFTLNGYVDPYVAFRLESRFYDGRVPAKKLWLSPLKLTESAGITRHFYKTDDDFVTSRFGAAIRQTFTSNIADTVLLSTVDSTFMDGGFESVSDVSLGLNDKIRWTSKLTLFKAIYFDKSDQTDGTPTEGDWKAIDVDWENILAVQVSKVIAVSFYTQLLYDKQIIDKGRLKQTLALGLSYKMF
jgi:hypothetical protein